MREERINNLHLNGDGLSACGVERALDNREGMCNFLRKILIWKGHLEGVRLSGKLLLGLKI